MTTQFESFVEGYMKANPDFAESIKPGSEKDIAIALSRSYELIRGELRNTVGQQVDMDSAIRGVSRPWAKSRGQGRFIKKYLDRRDEQFKVEDGKLALSYFNKYMERVKTKYISRDPFNLLQGWVEKNCLVESDWAGSFVFGVLMDGVVIERYTPKQLLDRISGYIDHENTMIAEKEQDAEFRTRALHLEGYTLSDLKDPKVKQIVDTTIEQLKKGYFSIPTAKKLPAIDKGEFLQEKTKEAAFNLGLPLDPKSWSLEEKRRLEFQAQNTIEEYKAQLWEPLNTTLAERSPEFYKSAVEKYYQLDYYDDGN